MKLTMLSNTLHKLRVIEQKLLKRFEDETGFSLTRYQILIFLKERGSKLSIEISEFLGIDPAAVARHIKILENKGYIEKERSKTNGREIIISLTEFAKIELEKCKEKHKENEYNLPLPITEDELNSFNNILENIDKKLENGR